MCLERRPPRHWTSREERNVIVIQFLVLPNIRTGEHTGEFLIVGVSAGKLEVLRVTPEMFEDQNVPAVWKHRFTFGVEHQRSFVRLNLSHWNERSCVHYLLRYCSIRSRSKK